MTTTAFEAFLAKLYVDDLFRAAFLKDPLATARQAGLSGRECEALAAIDREGLEMASSSLLRKRQVRPR